MTLCLYFLYEPTSFKKPASIVNCRFLTSHFVVVLQHTQIMASPAYRRSIMESLVLGVRTHSWMVCMAQ